MRSEKDKILDRFEGRRLNLAVFCLIAVLVVIAYSNAFTSSFHFDDDPAIVQNAITKSVTLDHILAIISGARPVVNLSILINYQLSGLHVIGWHIFNIGLHIANSFLVYLFILRTLMMPSLKAKFSEKAKWLALFGSLLFALHPIQTETVTYIISRSELLATFFYLGTILLFISGVRTGKGRYYAAAVISSLLAMGSKEWAVTLPALIVLYDFLFLAEGRVKYVLSRWYLYGLVALPPIWFVLFKLDLFAPGGSSSMGFNVATVTGITPSTYLFTSFNIVWTYIRLLIIPIGQNIDYDYPIAKTLFELPTILSFLGHLAVVCGVFLLYKKRKWILVPFGAAWFYITLSPVQSFVPLTDVIFEHRLYLPSIGFFLAFVVIYEKLFTWIEQRDASGVLLGDVSENAFAPKESTASPKGGKITRKAVRRAKKGGVSA